MLSMVLFVRPLSSNGMCEMWMRGYLEKCSFFVTFPIGQHFIPCRSLSPAYASTKSKRIFFNNQLKEFHQPDRHPATGSESRSWKNSPWRRHLFTFSIFHNRSLSVRNSSLNDVGKAAAPELHLNVLKFEPFRHYSSCRARV